MLSTKAVGFRSEGKITCEFFEFFEIETAIKSLFVSKVFMNGKINSQDISLGYDRKPDIPQHENWTISEAQNFWLRSIKSFKLTLSSLVFSSFMLRFRLLNRNVWLNQRTSKKVFFSNHIFIDTESSNCCWHEKFIRLLIIPVFK